MSIEELQAKLNDINAQRDELTRQARALAKEIEAMRVRERVAAMPEAEREALRQALMPAGIESAESAGTPIVS